MAFLDKVNKMAKNLGEMAGDAVENGKLNIKLMEEKGKLAEAYAQLGEAVYQQHKGIADTSQKIEELLVKIDGHTQQIEALQAEQQQPAQPAQAAPAPAPAWDAASQPAPEAPAAGAAKFCPGCGTKLDDGAKFCANCGTAI